MTDFRDWPRDANGAFVCSASRPMPPSAVAHGKGKQWVHLGAINVGECFYGCCDRYQCQDCGQEWLIEARQ